MDRQGSPGPTWRPSILLVSGQLSRGSEAPTLWTETGLCLRNRNRIKLYMSDQIPYHRTWATSPLTYGPPEISSWHPQPTLHTWPIPCHSPCVPPVLQSQPDTRPATPTRLWVTTWSLPSSEALLAPALPHTWAQSSPPCTRVSSAWKARLGDMGLASSLTSLHYPIKVFFQRGLLWSFPSCLPSTLH